jgi:hypothetical protein
MKLFRKRKIIYGCDARGDAQSPYLTRWELLSCKYFAIYLHRFERSDDRSSLHDHPWNFITIPLKYGYNDCTYDGGWDENKPLRDGGFEPTFKHKLMKCFRIYYRPATHIHFVELLWDGKTGEDKKAWTLVIRFKYIRYWGFWRKGLFTVFHTYFTQNGC